MKKIIASVAAAALTVSAMAVAANAATDLAVDNSKIYFADIEGNGALRIEIYNEYGDTKNDPPIDRDKVKDAAEIDVTFTISGVPSGEFDAVVKFADGSWAANSMADGFTAPTFKINGDGTYTVKSGFPAWEDEETGAETPAIANGVMVFCVDIIGLAEAADAGKGSQAYDDLASGATAADKQKIAEDAGISVTNVSVKLLSAEDLNPPATTEATTTAPSAPATGDTTTNENPKTGIEGVAIVAGLAVIATGAVVVSKKRK